MYLCSTPSLETRWLQRQEKWMSQPDVVYVDRNCSEMSGGSGAYCQPRSQPIRVDGKEIVPGPGGIILIGIKHASLPEPIEFAATIAHEWRHGWQKQSGFEFDQDVELLRSQLPYEESLKRYFRGSKTETDALWFQWIKTHSPLSEYWVDLVHKAA